MVNYYVITFMFGKFNWKKFVYETADKHTMLIAAHNEEEAKKLFPVHAEYAYKGRGTITILRIDPYVEPLDNL